MMICKIVKIFCVLDLPCFSANQYLNHHCFRPALLFSQSASSADESIYSIYQIKEKKL